MMITGGTVGIGTAGVDGMITGALVMAEEEEDTEGGIMTTGEGDGTEDTTMVRVSQSERNVARSHFNILFSFQRSR